MKLIFTIEADEQSELEPHINGPQYQSALEEITREIRKHYKYGSEFTDVKAFIEYINTFVRAEIKDRNLTVVA